MRFLRPTRVKSRARECGPGISVKEDMQGTDMSTTNTTPANNNRASAGISPDTLLAMVAIEGCYTWPGRAGHCTVIGHRDNHMRDHHSSMLELAARRLRRYGIRVRRSMEGGRVSHLTVVGPRRGGRAGMYSA